MSPRPGVHTHGLATYRRGAPGCQCWLHRADRTRSLVPQRACRLRSGGRQPRASQLRAVCGTSCANAGAAIETQHAVPRCDVYARLSAAQDGGESKQHDALTCRHAQRSSRAAPPAPLLGLLPVRWSLSRRPSVAAWRRASAAVAAQVRPRRLRRSLRLARPSQRRPTRRCPSASCARRRSWPARRCSTRSSRTKCFAKTKQSSATETSRHAQSASLHAQRGLRASDTPRRAPGASASGRDAAAWALWRGGARKPWAALRCAEAGSAAARRLSSRCTPSPSTRWWRSATAARRRLRWAASTTSRRAAAALVCVCKSDARVGHTASRAAIARARGCAVATLTRWCRGRRGFATRSRRALPPSAARLRRSSQKWGQRRRCRPPCSSCAPTAAPARACCTRR